MHVVSVSTEQEGPHAGQAILRALERELAGALPQLVFLFCSPAQPLAELMPVVSAGLPTACVLGASTAGEFTERGDTKRAACALAVVGDMRITAGIGRGLRASPEAAVGRSLEGQPSSMHGYPHRTTVLLLDPLAGNGEETTLLAAAALGEDTALVGGAAGDYLQMQQTWVGTGSDVDSDAVVIAQIFSKQPLGIGIAHGHRAMSEPIMVTEAEGNVVRTLDGRPAWDVWKEKTRARALARGCDVTRLDPAEIPGFLLQYEAGLSVGSEIKLRSPLHLNPDGSLGFACGMPKGTVFRITESEPEGQIDSARRAAREARANLGGAEAAGAVAFDCICRNLILGQRFQEAVRAMSAELGDAPLAGFETYGEIALSVGDMSGFHNTTSVVLAFPR